MNNINLLTHIHTAYLKCHCQTLSLNRLNPWDSLESFGRQQLRITLWDELSFHPF